MTVRELFPAPRALRPDEDGPVLLVSERTTADCGCAVYIGTLAGKGTATVAAFPCPQHDEAINTFRSYLAEALAPNPVPTHDKLTTLASELLAATLWEYERD